MSDLEPFLREIQYPREIKFLFDSPILTVAYMQDLKVEYELTIFLDSLIDPFDLTLAATFECIFKSFSHPLRTSGNFLEPKKPI